jgi:hypothetical protein
VLSLTLKLVVIEPRLQELRMITIRKKLTRWWAVICFVFAFAPGMFASLGGNLESVQSDQAKMMANRNSREALRYTVHEMKTPAGVVIREYVSSAGRVFGIAWQGPFLPDMRQLLGSYFPQFSAAAKRQRESHVGRHLLNIQEQGLVAEANGHMRAYSGRVYVPTLLPEGVDGHEVR